MNQQISPVKVALTATAVLATSLAAYAVYFDYKRRNDPEFRRNLMKEKKKVQKSSQQQQALGHQEAVGALKRALALINSEPVPSDAGEKEQYFMEQVAMGEQLAARSSDFYVASAISFYKALKVYPAPSELIMIYQKTQPPEVFDLVMEMIALDVAESEKDGSRRSVDPRDSSSGAVLTEIEPESTSTGSGTGVGGATTTTTTTSATTGPTSTTTTPAAPRSIGSDNGSGSSPSSGSYVHVDEVKEAVNLEGESVIRGADPPEVPLAI